MIKRYTPEKIGAIWTDEMKFKTWFEVELAVIKAHSALGEYPSGIADEIRSKAVFTSEAIHERDKQIEHDLQAFVDVVRASLPLELRGYVHDGLTSYDIEEPALSLQWKQAGDILIEDLTKLIAALRKKASEHAWTYCMGLTHGQDAKPTTFGWRLCGYLEAMERGLRNLKATLEQVMETKCSGAVGNYMTISPELEKLALASLLLYARNAATQIVTRDVHARILDEISLIGADIEKMATDLRFLASSPVQEIREPRKKKQKGSSAMPHKRNPILLERMCGMAIMLRGYAAMGKELVRTWLERDIAHSSVERIAFPDATILLDYMLQKMTWITDNLEVNREHMAESIHRSRGTWASEEVKQLLLQKVVDPEEVYEWLQTSAFEAIDTKQDFRKLLEVKLDPDKVTPQELENCFNFADKLKNLKTGYERMGLDLTQTLPPNITHKN